METKHTKGKWYIIPMGQYVDDIIISEINDNERVPIAAISKKDKTFDEFLHNIQLINSAPDLLEALIEAKENWKGDKLLGGTYEKIINAINKATK